MLLHFYYNCEVFPGLQYPAQVEIVENFRGNGLIKHRTGFPRGVWGTTKKGEAWVKAIIATPVPRQVFIDAQGKVIE